MSDIIPFELAWTDAEKITGYLLKEEAKVLFDEAMAMPENGVFVELGSFCGKSTRVIVDAVKARKGKLICIDAYIPHFDKVPTGPEEALSSITQYVLTPFYDWVELIQKKTVVAAKYFYGSIDVLFIDADHSYKGVKEDCEHWLPKLKHGGVVIFHDFNDKNWADVSRAALEYVGDWPNFKNDCSVAVFRKP